MSEPTRILIVDDSRCFRSALEQVLASVKDVQVIGSVWNGNKALEFLRHSATPPDLITLDVEMPELNGLETLKGIQQYNGGRPGQPPVGVLMVSAFTQEGARQTIEALELGAFDFVTKPATASVEESMQLIRQQVVTKIQHFRLRRLQGQPPTKIEPRRQGSSPAIKPIGSRDYEAILIAVSTGGPEVLARLLPSLAPITDLPIFIVQHMPAYFLETLATSLGRRCSQHVVLATDGMVVKRGTIYLAPGNHNLLVRRLTDGAVVTTLSDQPSENGFTPCADVLFRSAAPVYGNRVIALVLTGMLSDGTVGLGPLKRAGAYVIAQDKETSVVWGMPGSAVAAGLVDEILPPERIPEAIARLLGKQRMA